VQENEGKSQLVANLMAKWKERPFRYTDTFNRVGSNGHWQSRWRTLDLSRKSKIKLHRADTDYQDVSIVIKLPLKKW